MIATVRRFVRQLQHSRDTISIPTWHGGARDIRAGDRTERIAVRAVTPNLFELLGVAPLVGRGFTGSTVDATSVVLSHRVWHQLFDGRIDVTGEVAWIDNRRTPWGSESRPCQCFPHGREWTG